MSVLTTISLAVQSLPTEIAVFLLAFCLHWVVFRTRRIPKKRSAKVGKQMQSPSIDVNCKKATTSKQLQTPTTHASCNTDSSTRTHLLAFATAAESICKDISGKQLLATKIQTELEKVPFEDRVDALTVFLQGMARCKAHAEALPVVCLLLEENGLKLSMALAESLLHGHLVHGYMPQVQQTAQKMREAGLQPKVATFNQLLETSVKRCPKHVWAVINEMKLCGAKPDRITCAILLKTVQANATSVNVERILTFVGDMNEQVDEVLLICIVEACLRVVRPDLLQPYLRSSIIKAAQIKNPHSYGSIIRAYGFLKDTKGVWDTWCEMRTRHVMPNSVTLGCMVEALTTNGDVEAGYDFVRQISKDERCHDQINAVIYGSILKGFAQQKKFERLWSVYQEMLDLKLQFSIVTFNTLVDACARSREMNRIPALLESMVDQGIQPNLITYSAILKGYCQANRLDEAFQLMEQMPQTTEFHPDEIMYNTLLDGCARLGFYHKGMAVLEEMQQVGVPPTNFTLSVLVKLASRSKQLDKAFELCDKLSSKYNFRLNMHVYSNLVHGCTMSNDIPRAMQVLEKMLSERVRPDARTYTSLLRACIVERCGQDAAGLLRAAMGLSSVHPKLVGKPTHLLKPQGHLTVELIEHVLHGIAGLCGDKPLALHLLHDLQRLPGLRLDPKLLLHLGTKQGD